MADVAERVGVSRQLVGLVFRNQAGVSKETRAKILAAADELGYSPNVAAQNLRRTSTKYIGVIFDPSHSAALEILESLYAGAHAANYNLVVSSVTANRDETDAITELLGYRCEALILIAPRCTPAELKQTAGRIPVIVIGRRIERSPFDVVRSAGDQGIEAVVNHLIELGHKHIAYVNGVDMLDADVRVDGYSRAMIAHGLDELVIEVHSDYTEASGSTAADALLSESVLPTAVVCCNDQAALGMVSTLAQAGVSIPGDVSVTGYDDSRVARLPFMNLTTLHQDPHEVGEAAMSVALKRINGELAEPVEILTSAKLVIRKSTAAPRS
jgi:DNA-binding LacI/PurR family transcriptional regulator